MCFRAPFFSIQRLTVDESPKENLIIPTSSKLCRRRGREESSLGGSDSHEDTSKFKKEDKQMITTSKALAMRGKERAQNAVSLTSNSCKLQLEQ